MKRIFISIALALVCLHALPCGAVSNDRWHSDKFSMFIHFGLYSHLGGVWDGKRVEWGYSEQIQSFAGIFSDWYALTAEEFDPVGFNADSIAVLAKRAGMRSIVFTSKHHDGFCMFNTATTDFNSVRMTPSHRDYVRELSEACRRHGLNFGLYFSIIDWRNPYGHPISSHNADFVTPQHHDLNKAQVSELLTNYGNISELWFDMGSQTPQQSRELYELVHKLQPECMVSGRVGNDCYDFAVMADNKYPDSALQTPWQSAASMFDETWGYRSWQHRGSICEKTDQKLRSLINVVSHGGNYLLNIGPDGNGNVIEFEQEVLLGIGRWLKTHGEAIYGTQASPFREDFSWGAVTIKGKRMNLILSGEKPKDGMITLHMPGYHISGSNCTAAADNGNITVHVPKQAYRDGRIEVLTIDFTEDILPVSVNPIDLRKPRALNRDNATKDFSYSCFDYYSNYKSTVAHNWHITQPGKSDGMEFVYTAQECGRTIRVEIDGTSSDVLLEPSRAHELKGRYSIGPMFYTSGRAAMFDAPDTCTLIDDVRLEGWTAAESDEVTLCARQFTKFTAMRNIRCSKECDLIIEVCAGNGIELFHNGSLVMKHLNPYRCTYRKEKVLLHLDKGDNFILLRAYNRFEDSVTFGIGISQEQTVYRSTFKFPASDNIRHIRISSPQSGSIHTDAQLHNILLMVH